MCSLRSSAGRDGLATLLAVGWVALAVRGLGCGRASTARRSGTPALVLLGAALKAQADHTPTAGCAGGCAIVGSAPHA